MPVLRGDRPPEVSPALPYAQPIHPPGTFAAPPPSSNSKTVKAVLITIAVFVGLGVLAVGALGFATWYFGRSIHEVPSASFTASDLGIAIYPGAEPSLHGSRARIAGKSLLNATYYTADPVEQVVAFYKQKAGPKALPIASRRGSAFRVSTAAGDTTTVHIMRVPDEPGGTTYITIARVIDNPASN